MTVEKFMFPAIVVGAFVSIWAALRTKGDKGAAVASPSTSGPSAAPTAATPAFLFPQHPGGVPGLYLAPTRFDPPASLTDSPYPNTLRYPADLTAADGVGVTETFRVDNACGCCG